MAAPTRCKTRRSRRCSTRAKWTAARIDIVAGKLQRVGYAARFVELFGGSVWSDPRLAVSEALFAVARYQIEDVSFHSYTQQVRLSGWKAKRALPPSELRGYALFNDPAKANCAGCHVDQPTRDGLPPLFTDHQFEALGAPRNAALAVNGDPGFFDLGICGPYRRDMSADTQYCGLFMTPTLRNVATRHVFFHNGVYSTLKQVLDFYDFRDTEPQTNLSAAARRNGRKIQRSAAGLSGQRRRHRSAVRPQGGRPPAMTDADEDDIIAFLNTLVDGYSVK